MPPLASTPHIPLRGPGAVDRLVFDFGGVSWIRIYPRLATVLQMFIRSRPRLSRFALLAVALIIPGSFYVSHRVYRHHRLHRVAPPLHLPPPPYNHPHSNEHKLWHSRAEEVKVAFLRAYKGYRRYAFPHDELKPVIMRGGDNLNGWGLTMVDALDTMWIMGLQDEFQEALPFVANMTFALDEAKFAPFFETVIRYLGGLLSAYALSNETVLLDRADDLGTKLLPAFNTTSGLPANGVNTVTGEMSFGWLPGTVMLSEVASCQMEYKYLAHLTGRSEYFEKVERAMNVIRRTSVRGGMLPTQLHIVSGAALNHMFSVGAFADSAFEYMLKQWLLSSRVESKALNLYLRSVSAILENLLYLSPTRHLLYVTDAETTTDPPTPSRRFEHLSCFLPGLLALGAHTLPPSALSPRDRELHLWAAEGLANTCWILYREQEAGLGPDEVEFHNTQFKYDDGNPSVGYVKEKRRKREGLLAGRWMEHVKEWESAGRPGGVPPGVKDPKPVMKGLRDYANKRREYFLRPEAVESFYLMWRTTGDRKWRERGWDVFQAIELRTRTPTAYASLMNVQQVPSQRLDEMPSYFLAETLKYLYLLFREDDPIPLDRWVFNTEGHAFPMFEWTVDERTKYRIY
ncbi:hypothetical protein EIP91_007599 [Steccherinum ochraceum]|uniref:alpha-1,2-Mannosidase n=1 Tax=Steccherinum ochraceum TaxID=92696 RepID=A0A4R0RQK2_9APHY|nr:hypothetical protein EIP91_007599 [Steccherinum ochraceum]